MKKITLRIATLAAALWAALTSAAAPADTTITRFEGQPIAAIETRGAITVTARQGEATGVTVTLPRRLADRLAVDLRDGLLSIDLKTSNLKRGETCRVEITHGPLRSIDLSGACALTLDGDHSADSLAVKVSGASSIKIPGTLAVARHTVLTLLGASHLHGTLLCDSLLADIRGSSSLTLSGEGDTARVLVSGTSRADLSDFPLTAATAEATGASRLTLHITETLRARATGASRVAYSGSPSTLDLHTSGLSKITPR